MPLVERFWPRVQRGDYCWEWTGARQSDGYGTIGRSAPASGSMLTHRVAWELTKGPIPAGARVLHHCDNPPCVRPDHLYLGDQKQNAADRTARGRDGGKDRRGEHNGRAKLTADQAESIRILYATGKITQIRLAQAFGVDQTNISAIVRRSSWQS